MRRVLLGLGILLISAAPACGSSAPGPVEPRVGPTPGPGGPAPAAVATSPAFDLSPVADPPDLVGVARWRSPGATFSSASSTAGLPAALAESTSKMAVEGILKEALRGIVDARQMAQLVSLDASVDAALVLDPAPRKKDVLGAVSFGVTSLERAREVAEASGAVHELSPGVWRIGGKERFGTACVLAASAGPSPARIVCGPREKDVVTLTPYLVRSVAVQPAPATDLHAEIRFTPVVERFGPAINQQLAALPAIAESMVSLGEPRFDRAVTETAGALGEEAAALLKDIDKISLDVGLAPATGLTATGALQVRGRKSWLMQTLAERPERAGPPPAIFWRAPKDSDSAFFSRGSDPARWAPIVKTVRSLLEGGLGKLEVGSKADREALSALLATPLGKDTNVVQASGHFDVPQRAGKPTPQQALDDVVNGWFGWHLIGLDEGPAAVTKYLKDAVAVYNRASLMAPIKKQMGRDAKLLPTLKTVPAPKELGKNALAIELKMTDLPADDLPIGEAARGAKGKVAFTAHLLLMADGNSTWIAIGASRDELVKRLLAVKSGAPDTATLSGRPGLEALKSGANMSGGFMTLASFTKSLPVMQPLTSSDPAAKQILVALQNLPHKGETPIVTHSRVTGGGAGATELSLNLPKPALEDAATIATHIMKAVMARQSVAAPPSRP